MAVAAASFMQLDLGNHRVMRVVVKIKAPFGGLNMAMGQYPVLSRGPPPPSVTNPCRAGFEGECAKYRKKMRIQKAVNPEASIVQERGLGFKV